LPLSLTQRALFSCPLPLLRRAQADEQLDFAGDDADIESQLREARTHTRSCVAASRAGVLVAPTPHPYRTACTSVASACANAARSRGGVCVFVLGTQIGGAESGAR
jgi:hypothetical protein